MQKQKVKKFCTPISIELSVSSQCSVLNKVCCVVVGVMTICLFCSVQLLITVVCMIAKW